MVTLYCKSSSPEGAQPKTRWLKDGRLLNNSGLPHRYSVNNVGTLDIDGKNLKW